ncbi:phage major capsid protein [Psychrobacter pocilloporae]|uniref:phage major capsid protein n=1 Tax=Psychrobacter pocilloporae TaxID=1775882 RepID=UPI003C2C5484
MTWEQRRAQILATIESKKGLKVSIMTKSRDENRTTNDDEESQIQEVDDDIAKLTKELGRVDEIIKDIAAAKKDATPAAGANPEQSAASADGDPEPQKATKSVTVTANTAKKGVGFAQLAKAKALAVIQQKNGNSISPLDVAKSQGMDPRVIQVLEKAVVLDMTNSSDLIVENELSNEFIELLRAETIVDKLAPSMRKAPFNAKIPGAATGAVAAWVGEGAAKPATNPTFNSIKIEHHKLAGIVVRTDELLKLSSPSTDQMLRDDLIEATATLIDTTFMDDSPKTDDRPAGVLNGATKVAATGKTSAEYDADLAALNDTFISQNLSLTGAYYVMSATRASAMGRLRDALGNPYYRGMSNGPGEKTLEGLPVIESENAGAVIALIKPSELYLADEDQVELAFSDQATIDMGSTTLVNLWQKNMSAIRAERHITWEKRRTIAAAYIDYSELP